MSRFQIGPTAGHHFNGQADLTVAKHVQCGKRKGFFCTRKRLVDRAAFNYDPLLGWEVDRWFEWPDEKKAKVKA